MTALPFNPPKVHFVDSRGQVSREWLLWLQALWRITGAQAGVDVSGLQTEVDGLQTDVGVLQTDVDTAESDIDTLQATVSSLQSQINALKLPVGSIYVSVSATNPAATLGYGTWQSFGSGRVLVGVDTGDTDFDTVEETGGAKTVTF